MPSDRTPLEKLSGTAVAPIETISESDRRRLTVSKTVLDTNYLELADHIDGELATNPMFICRKEEKRDAGFEVLRLLHNYLSSLYSFNESVRVLFNRYTDDETHLASSHFTPGDEEDGTYYQRKLAFLRGLRTDFQHGGFSCLDFKKAGELGEFTGYHVEFDRQAFVGDSGLRNPEEFLRQTNENEQQYPLCFIGQFHRETLKSFYEETEAWFDSSP